MTGVVMWPTRKQDHVVVFVRDRPAKNPVYLLYRHQFTGDWRSLRDDTVVEFDGGPSVPDGLPLAENARLAV